MRLKVWIVVSSSLREATLVIGEAGSSRCRLRQQAMGSVPDIKSNTLITASFGFRMVVFVTESGGVDKYNSYTAPFPMYGSRMSIKIAQKGYFYWEKADKTRRFLRTGFRS